MNYKELDARSKHLKPVKLNRFQIEHTLERKYEAKELPLFTIPRKDYENDEEVDEKRIYKLYTITNKQVLKQIQNKDDINAIKEPFLSTIYEKASYIVSQTKSKNDGQSVSYNQLIHEHNHGKRVSVVLEKDETDYVTNFKVYGFAHHLVTYLVARIGIEGMKEGDMTDTDYQFYLECLAANGFI
ncbi:hypothetical protein CHH77_06560 [Shouchella clausii]|uniref:hypothetical protein n=1 Tax=Shouchella TaxID=2893057 RepID=UPI000BA5C3D4|nr:MULTISPECIES: hypothetical protein [Shouchella]MCM3378631.1 hypothetical protein [Shouchella rhizosphaerae]PAE83603.1 hypothetical protein CHH77_06560 [Shouchella clausii]